MSSLFTTSDVTMGRSRTTVPFYLQFVPGYVVEVITSNSSLLSGNDSANINSILAIPHITDKPINRISLNQSNRYYPLLRGIVDVPAKGDPVILCTIGKINYYLGPLNTTNDPNWNSDNLQNSKIGVDSYQDSKSNTSRLKKGESLNFDKISISRLQKPLNSQLDHPWVDDITMRPELNEKGLPKGRAIGEVHGDMVLEGRHGNSIRIGSRHINPYIYISNSRAEENVTEGLSDGSLIAITEKGTLAQHFGKYAIKPLGTDTDNSAIIFPEFKLSSDTLEGGVRTIADLVSLVSGDNIDYTNLIYKYNKNQTLIHSDRIIINSKGSGNAPELGGDIFLSSFQDIHIGTGRHLTISTNKDLIIESRNIYIGKASKIEEEKEPLVLGKQLTNILKDLVDCLSSANYISMAGVPLPLVDSMQQPISSADNPALQRKSLKTISGELRKFLSNYHYIESNDKPNKNE